MLKSSAANDFTKDYVIKLLSTPWDPCLQVQDLILTVLIMTSHPNAQSVDKFVVVVNFTVPVQCQYPSEVKVKVIIIPLYHTLQMDKQTSPQDKGFKTQHRPELGRNKEESGWVFVFPIASPLSSFLRPPSSLLLSSPPSLPPSFKPNLIIRLLSSTQIQLQTQTSSTGFSSPSPNPNPNPKPKPHPLIFLLIT